MSKATGFTREQKILIASRDLECVIHYQNTDNPAMLGPCAGDLTHHHRKNRGHGGVKSRNRVANGLLICASANGRLTSDPAFIAYGYARGWIVRSDLQIDSEMVWIPRLRTSAYLDDAGQYLDFAHNPITERKAA